MRDEKRCTLLMFNGGFAVVLWLNGWIIAVNRLEL